MPTASKSSSDARSGANASTGGVETCQPTAPGRGTKPGSMRKRVAGSLPHQPASRGSDASLAWRAWTNAPAGPARPGVDVLVVAPGRPVDAPRAELERHVADRVREIPADHRADVVRRRRHGGDVDELAREVVDAAEQHERDRSAQPLELGDDVLGAQRRLTLAGLQAHDGRARDRSRAGAPARRRRASPTGTPRPRSRCGSARPSAGRTST